MNQKYYFVCYCETHAVATESFCSGFMNGHALVSNAVIMRNFYEYADAKTVIRNLLANSQSLGNVFVCEDSCITVLVFLIQFSVKT